MRFQSAHRISPDWGIGIGFDRFYEGHWFAYVQLGRKCYGFIGGERE